MARGENILHDPTATVSVRLMSAPRPMRTRTLSRASRTFAKRRFTRSPCTETHQHRGDVVGLLGVFGGECAGALSLDNTDSDLARHSVARMSRSSSAGL